MKLDQDPVSSPITKSFRFATLLVGLGLSLLGAQSAEAACGVIEIAKGDIKIESKGKVTAGAAQSKVCEGDAIVAGPQSRAKVKMADGNELNISPESRIVLETYQYKPTDNKKKVLLNVVYGKVRAATAKENMYNDAAADGQANSFQVKTKAAVAGVRGTDFLTSFNMQTNKAEVVTFKGEVMVGQMGPGGVILNPVAVGAGQKTEAIPGAPPAPPKIVPPTEMQQMSSESVAAKDDPPRAAVADQRANNEKKDENKNSNSQGNGQGQNASGGNASDKKNSNASGGTASTDSGSSSGSTSSGSSTSTRTPATTSGGTSTAGPAPTGPSTGSMIDAKDLGTAPLAGPALPTTGTSIPVFVPPPTIDAVLPPPPVCEFCNQQIESGPAKVNVRVTIGN
ncbi:MAG TPA: FecR family protein [Pseudobdellovibrionaceae bacterium]|nr:FecR family protein [Pseudobdellovibrionaceae bacterium]